MRPALLPRHLVILAIVVLGGVAAIVRGGDGAGIATPGSPGSVPAPGPGMPLPADGAKPSEAADVHPDSSRVSAQDFCADAGYLCAGLDTEPMVTLRRWSGHDGTLVVHVPLPEGIDATRARALQRAASAGIRAWNNQPFPILVDVRGDRDPHFRIEWRPSLGGTQLGVTRTRWTRGRGLDVVAVSLGTNHPRTGAPVEPGQIRLTAAHEMGHALGLPHSDEPRDVMYPVNTATSMSARDYRSVEVLYGSPDGTVIVR